MTKQERTEAINRSFDAMLFAQALMDMAVTDREKNLAEAIYEAHNAIYWILVGDKRKEKQS